MKLSITCILLFIFQLSFSQDSWINYTNSHRINDVAETDNGYWLGSTGGLTYYNTESGDETYYNRGNSMIPSNVVTDLLYLSNEELWFTSNGGLCKFIEDEFALGPKKLRGLLRKTLDDKIIVVNFDSLYIQEEGMDFKAIAYPEYAAGIGGAEVDQETGALKVFVNNWFSDSYLAIWENNEWTTLTPDFVYDSAMTMDKENKLWLINSNGLQYLENDIWKIVSEAVFEEQIRYPKLFVNNENDIVILNNEDEVEIRVWDGVSLEELKYFADGNSKYNYFIKPSDFDDDVYYGSNLSEGFYSFTKDEINESKKLAQSPILSNTVRNTLHKSDGSHILIFANGIQQINSGIWSEIPIPEDISSSIRKGFLDVDENLWIRDDYFLWTYQNEEWIMLLLPSEINEELGLVEFGKNGDIWVQSSLNIVRFKENQWKVFTSIHHDLTNTSFKNMKVDPDNGDLWITSFQGVRHYDGSVWKSYTPYSFNHTFGLTLGNGGAFVRFSEGLRFIKDGEIETIAMPPVGTYNTFVSKLFFNSLQDELYMTGSGIIAIYRNNEWTTYSYDDTGLYDGSTNNVNIDLDQNIWFSGSSGGVCIFNEGGITTLSIKEQATNIESLPVHIYPTLLSQDQFFVVSKVSGAYEIMVSGLGGKILYQQIHNLSKDVPFQVDLNSDFQNLFLVTISSQNRRVSKKLVRY